MEIFLLPETWVALATLTFLEIVLGVDNIIFISIVSNKLPQEKQARTRSMGLAFALVFRIGLLLGIQALTEFTKPLFTVMNHGISGRDLILVAGGIFLLFKSTMEIHHKMQGRAEQVKEGKATKVSSVILQIIVLDMVFSFDSILTAVGLVDEVVLMVIAVVISMAVMMVFAGRISRFINQNPTLQVLALSFLILIGFMLMVEGFHVEVPKGYIYFAVFFSLTVELVNMRLRKKTDRPVTLHKRMEGEPDENDLP